MLDPHELCKNFPPLADKALATKAADIKASGLKPEITVHEGGVLDDYNLYRACLEAGVEPRLVPFTGESPVDFAVRQNVADQNYSSSQRAAFAHDLLLPYQAEARQRQLRATLPEGGLPEEIKGKAVDIAAARLGTSGRYVQDMVKIAGLMPEIIPLLRAGDLAVNKAMKFATALTGLTHDERQELCDAGVEALVKATTVEVPPLEYLTGDAAMLEAQPDESVSLFLATDNTGMEVAAAKLTPGGVLLCYSSLPHPTIKGLKQWCEFGINQGKSWRPLIGHTKSKRERPAWHTERLQEEELLRRLLKPADKPKRLYKIGTKQIAEEVCNIADGCSHNCLMCYRQKLCDWRGEPEEGRDKPVFRNNKQAEKHWNTTVLFSSNHDTEPSLLEESVVAMRQVLKQGNHLIWVTKPHMICVERICREFKPSEKFTFMPTIMTLNESLQKFWAPGATGCEETFACLKRGHAAHFRTSVICEPMLDAENIVELYETVAPYITDEFLVGPMNHLADIRKRHAGLPGIGEALAEIEKWQTKDSLWKIHGWLVGKPKVKFKDDFRKTLGLPPNGCA
jgi:DNA repair photolyase